MADKKKTVDEYIAGLEDWQQPIVTELRQIVRKAAPDAKESVKWAQPVYEHQGPFAYIRAFKSTVNIGFWRGTELTDPKGLLEGDGDRMKHLKIKTVKDIPSSLITDFVKQALVLNDEKGDPTKGRK